jgi:uncharacterized membrane protein HdeD (DUF308 family)
MIWITLMFGFCAIITGVFIILELNWSIQNIMDNWKKFWGPLKIFAILLAPFCFMPVILDVLITIGVGMLLGTSGMMGMMVSMLVTSIVAAFLYYMRRKHNWKYI